MRFITPRGSCSTSGYRRVQTSKLRCRVPRPLLLTSVSVTFSLGRIPNSPFTNTATLRKTILKAEMIFLKGPASVCEFVLPVPPRALLPTVPTVQAHSLARVSDASLGNPRVEARVSCRARAKIGVPRGMSLGRGGRLLERRADGGGAPLPVQRVLARLFRVGVGVGVGVWVWVWVWVRVRVRP